MNTRLPEALPLASFFFVFLLLAAPLTVLAQQSRGADSLRARSSDRARSPSDRGRAVDSRNASDRGSRASSDRGRAADTRADSDRGRAVDSRAARGSTRRESTRPAQEPGRQPAARPLIDIERRTTAGTAGRDNDDRRDNDDARNRDDDRGRDYDDGRSRENDWPGRSVDPRDRDYDRRDEEERGRGYDGRGRDQDRRERDYDRRDRDPRRGGPVIINKPSRPNSWGRPRVEIDIQWPWVQRYERRWSPRYRYRQVVYVDAGWGRHHRESRLDLRTYYRHRVHEASARRAVVDIVIDKIEIYEDGFFVGEVRHIPDDLAVMRAVVDRRNGVRFDRDVFLLGDPYAGFELVSTRHYGGYVLNRYRPSHGVRVGALDLRRERVVKVGRSQFFDPHEFSGFVPVSLLPEDAGWLIDYGYDSYSGHYWGDDDRYYYGMSDIDEYARLGGDRTYYGQTEPGAGDVEVYFSESDREQTSGRSSQVEGRDVTSSRVTPERQALERSNEETYETESGARIRLKRESTIERVD